MFPSPEELQRRLAEAEIVLFIQRGAVDEELLGTAWYLHGVGCGRKLRRSPVSAARVRRYRVTAASPRPARSARP